MDERLLGPVVGLGTWRTFGGDEARAREVVGASLRAGCPVVETWAQAFLGPEERRLVERLAGAR